MDSLPAGPVGWPLCCPAARVQPHTPGNPKLHTRARTGQMRHEPPLEPRGEIQALCSGSQFPAKPSPLLGPHGSPMLQKLVFKISLRTKSKLRPRVPGGREGCWVLWQVFLRTFKTTGSKTCKRGRLGHLFCSGNVAGEKTRGVGNTGRWATVETGLSGQGPGTGHERKRSSLGDPHSAQTAPGQRLTEQAAVNRGAQRSILEPGLCSEHHGPPPSPRVSGS